VFKLLYLTNLFISVFEYNLDCQWKLFIIMFNRSTHTPIYIYIYMCICISILIVVSYILKIVGVTMCVSCLVFMSVLHSLNL